MRVCDSVVTTHTVKQYTCSNISCVHMLLLTAITAYIWMYVKSTRMTHHVNVASLIRLRIQHCEQEISHVGQLLGWPRLPLGN